LVLPYFRRLGLKLKRRQEGKPRRKCKFFQPYIPNACWQILPWIVLPHCTVYLHYINMRIQLWFLILVILQNLLNLLHSISFQPAKVKNLILKNVIVKKNNFDKI
jgi:hypothetical protein